MFVGCGGLATGNRPDLPNYSRSNGAKLHEKRKKKKLLAAVRNCLSRTNNQLRTLREFRTLGTDKASDLTNDTKDRRLQEWLTKHEGLLIKIVRTFSFTPHDQDDLFQEIAFQLWQSADRYHHETAAETTWIYRVGLNTAISWTRKEKTRQKQRKQLTHAAHSLRSTSELIDPRLDWLYEQIALLNNIDRSLTLMMLDGFSYQEISETLGISVSHVGVKLNRIKKHLTKLASEIENEV